MKPFRERNPVPIGIVGTLILAMFAVLSFKAQDLPVFNGGGTVYKAHFAEAANLRKDNEVRIAGVKVGKVLYVELEGDHVVATFRVQKGVAVPRLTRAAIHVKTLVGAEFIALEPEGGGQLDSDTPIPLSRTTPPYELIPAFQDLASTVEGIDTTQLTAALNAVSDAFSDTAPNVRGTLDGLSRLSRVIASRDDELRQLLDHARNVTGVLADRDQELQQLIVDADKVLQVLDARTQVISSVLVNVRQLSDQLSGLIAENRAALAPALRDLQGVIETLNDNKAAIYRSMQVLAPFVRLFSNTIGTGHWFDTFITNLGPTECISLPGAPSLPPAQCNPDGTS